MVLRPQGASKLQIISAICLVVSSICWPAFPRQCSGSIDEHGLHVDCAFNPTHRGQKSWPMKGTNTCFFCCRNGDEIQDILDRPHARKRVLQAWNKLEVHVQPVAIHHLSQEQKQVLRFISRAPCAGRACNPCKWALNRNQAIASVELPHVQCPFCDDVTLAGRCNHNLEDVAADLEKMNTKTWKAALEELPGLHPYADQLLQLLSSVRKRPAAEISITRVPCAGRAGNPCKWALKRNQAIASVELPHVQCPFCDDVTLAGRCSHNLEDVAADLRKMNTRTWQAALEELPGLHPYADQLCPLLSSVRKRPAAEISINEIAEKWASILNSRQNAQAEPPPPPSRKQITDARC